MPLQIETTEKNLPTRKSTLKQKEYDIKLSETDLKEKDCFTTQITRA